MVRMGRGFHTEIMLCVKAPAVVRETTARPRAQTEPGGVRHAASTDLSHSGSCVGRVPVGRSYLCVRPMTAKKFYSARTVSDLAGFDFWKCLNY